MQKKKTTAAEVNMSRNPPGKDTPEKQREPGVSDETRVVHSGEADVRDGRSG